MSEDIVLQVGVKILLKNSEGKYLLLHRSAAKYPENKKPWDAVGGRINPGSSLPDNLKREISEETGLILQGVPRLIAAQDVLRMPGRHVVRLTYVGEATGTVILDTTENDAFRWFSKDELANLSDTDIYLAEVLKSADF